MFGYLNLRNGNVLKADVMAGIMVALVLWWVLSKKV
jgi:hypothetical protein